MALPQGINFRQTVGFVTDAANDSFEGDGAAFLTPPTYPRTTAQGNNVGWENGNNVNERDRQSGNNPKLAGLHGPSAAGDLNDYRIDLPSAGTYRVRIAAGDGTYANSCKVELFDTSTSKGVLCNGATGAANSFFDATGTIYTAANWPASNTYFQATFSTSILRFRNGAATFFSPLAHVYVEAVAAAGWGGLLAHKANRLVVPLAPT
jgi:hypothetical protein